MAKQDYERDWDKLPIKYLILSSKERYCVFIDHDNDLDWKTSDTFDSTELTPDVIKDFYQVKNEIDSVESIPCDHLDEKVIITFKRQVGEALVRALERDFGNAKGMIEKAKEYIVKRNTEESRFMYLTSSGLTTLVFIIIGIVFWVVRYCLINVIGETVFYLLLSSFLGSIGAFLSIIMRVGKTSLDFNASRKLHYLEGASRIMAGIISGFLVSLSIKSGILFPIYSKIGSIHIAMLLGGLIAGSSERFAPSIISKLDEQKV
ncbi:MAG: hypothetical protein QM734_07025 [Cyclobacteriaceae bacterium]